MMKKSVYILSGALTYVVLSLILSGYGNVYTHRFLNEAIVDVFLSEFNDATNKAAKFFNYEFEFKSPHGLEGEAITEGGLLYAKSSSKTMNASDWIRHGGFSADEPQLPASFRHFYDPTQDPGQCYLRDMLDFLDEKQIVSNPKIDHVVWGISHPDHQYSYNNGKEMFVSALQTADDDDRNRFMAFAWRALGETLHLIGDMGIPRVLPPQGVPPQPV